MEEEDEEEGHDASVGVSRVITDQRSPLEAETLAVTVGYRAHGICEDTGGVTIS